MNASTAFQKADLCGSLQTDREKCDVLAIAASGFGRSLRRVLSFVHGFGASIGEAVVEPLPAKDARTAVPAGAIELGGDNGFVRLACDPKLVDMCLEGALGGKRLTARERTTLSVAEKTLISRVLSELGAELSVSLKAATGRTPSADKPRADALRGQQKVYVARFPFEGDGIEASLTITVSRDVLDRVDGDAVLAEPVHVNDVMAGVMQDVDVALSAELGRTKVGLSSLLALQVGDVLRLTAATDDPITVRVGGVEKFNAVPVISRGQVSVEVSSRKAGRQS